MHWGSGSYYFLVQVALGGNMNGSCFSWGLRRFRRLDGFDQRRQQLRLALEPFQTQFSLRALS